jgi:hypothetical protein
VGDVSSLKDHCIAHSHNHNPPTNSGHHGTNCTIIAMTPNQQALRGQFASARV